MVQLDEFNVIYSDDQFDVDSLDDWCKDHYECIDRNMSSDETTLAPPPMNQEQSTFDIPKLVHYTHQIPTDLIGNDQPANDQLLLNQILEETKISAAITLHSNVEWRRDNLYLADPLDLNELDPSIIMELNEYAEEA